MQTKALGILAVASLFFGMACSSSPRTSNVSYEDHVKDSLKQADLTDVSVSEDKDKNTITLSGKVSSEDAKQDAGKIAQSAAGTRIIVNEISVQPVGAESEAKDIAKNSDDAIEKNYEAALIADGLNKEHISYDAKNGVLKLTGSVRSVPQRTEAQKIAQAIPNVEQVVNQIEIKR